MAIKNTKTPSQRRPTLARAKPVKFSLHCGEAKSVYLAGTFNDWNAETTPLHVNGDGSWTEQLALPPGTHEYQFVVDGRWTPDPQAPECIPNPFGGVNSVVHVTAEG